MILFFYGDNNYAARQKLCETEARYRDKNGDLGLEKIYGPEATAEKIIESLTTAPFLATSRLVVIEELSQNKPVAEAITKVFDRVADSTVVIFFETNPDKRTSFFKTLQKQAKSHEFKGLEPAKLQAWAKAKVTELGGSIEADALSELIERTGPNQWRLEQELKKLVNYQPKITSKVVLALVEPQFANTIFDLTEALARGQAGRAIELYQGLRAQREEPLKILGMIGWQLHNLLVIKAAGQRSASRRTDGEIAREAGINPYVISKTKAAAERVQLSHLQRTYQQLLETDYRLKSSSSDADVLLENLIVKVAGGLG